MKLLPTQRNDLFDAIVANGLSPSSFDIQENEVDAWSPSNTIVTFKSHGFFFRISSPDRDGWVEYTISPGRSVFQETRSDDRWSAILEKFSQWLLTIKEQITIIDKWSRLEEEMKDIKLQGSEDGNKFTAGEYEEIKLKMFSLKQRLIEVDLLPDQLRYLTDKIDHVTELAINMNKFDWRGLFIGTVISVIIQLNVTQENAHHLWQIIKQVFNNYFLP